MELGKGEALVSLLEGNGIPKIVERAMICPPSARLDPVTPEERKAVIQAGPVKGKYDQSLDSESAYEVLHGRAQQSPAPASAAPAPQGSAPPAPGGLMAGLGTVLR